MSALPGLDLPAIGTWLDAVLPNRALGAEVWQAEIISGGLSNITYRVHRGQQRLILRRPPIGPALPGAHDMQREYRILSALQGGPVPVPELIAYCADTHVIGSPFYVMREVDGTVFRTPRDTAALTPDQRRGISEDLVDVLADLHAVNPEAVGLGDYGKWGGYASRQIATWRRQWTRSRTRELPDMERLFTRLEAAVPNSAETTVVHGDYRLDNTIVTVAGPAGHIAIAAVLDWELSTLGDPLADLALMLTYWHDLGDEERSAVSVARGVTAHEGFLETRELSQRYASRTARDLSQLNFYLSLAAMKLAVILEGVHARFLAGSTVGEGYDSVASSVPLLTARGLRVLASDA